MTEKELHTYILTHFPKENMSCEWKKFASLKHNVSGHKGEDIISYVSAIANMEGGHLVIGIEDGTANITGIRNKHDFTPENLPNRLIGNCSYLSSEGLRVEEFLTNDTNKTVWVIHVPRHLPRKPVLAHKKAWQRSGESLIEMTHEREQAILSEPIHVIDDWSAKICEGATINDLDPKAIQKAKENFKKKFPNLTKDSAKWNDKTFLNKAKVTIKGKITNTAILLLGKPDSEHFIQPGLAKITWILKDKYNIELDYDHFSCPFLLNVNNVFQKIRNLKYRYIKDESLFPEEVDKYEPYVIREALHNCIAHQDYKMGGRINVVEKPDELIFTNLGGFIPGSVENVIKQDAPQELYRNTFLASAMFCLNMIDTIGSGIKRMFNFQRQRFFPMPEYQIGNQQIKVTIIGKVLDMDFAYVLVKNPDLILEEIVMLDKVQKKKLLREDEIKHLKNKKLIEGRKPNFHISAKVAEKIEQKSKYIRDRGIDDNYCRKIIIEYLKKFKTGRRNDFEDILLDKLPDILSEKQKKNKVKNNLQALRREDVIVLNEKKAWSLSKNNA